MVKVEKLKFVRLPKDRETGENLKEFEEMLGHIYTGYISSLNNEYVLLGGETKEGETAYQNSIYKSLLAIGESEETARGVAYEGEELEMCLYFPQDCFEVIEEE